MGLDPKIMKQALSEIGRARGAVGGKSRSPAKIAAVKRNLAKARTKRWPGKPTPPVLLASLENPRPYELLSAIDLVERRTTDAIATKELPPTPPTPVEVPATTSFTVRKVGTVGTFDPDGH